MRRAFSTLLISFACVPLTTFAAGYTDGSYQYPEPAWSPYIAGGLIGLLLVLAFAGAGKKIGASSAYMTLVGLLGRAVAPQHVRRLAYYQSDPPAVDWTLILVVCAIAGAFVAAWSGGELTGRYLQDLWVARFGSDSQGLRTAFAFVGGVLIALGARIAGGCTSGHGISGTAQMALGSWVAVISFFVGGIVTALLIYRL